MSLHQRNSEIIQERKSGKTYSDIASNFELSPGSIQQIVKRYHLEEERGERSSNLVADMRKLDDIDKKWSTEALLHGLNFPWLAKRCLTRHFEVSKMSEISLNDLMDFLITDYKEIACDLSEVCPVAKQKNVGWKTVWALLKFFSEQNFGPSFNAEWNKRLKLFIVFITEKEMPIPDWLHQCGS